MNDIRRKVECKSECGGQEECCEVREECHGDYGREGREGRVECLRNNGTSVVGRAVMYASVLPGWWCGWTWWLRVRCARGQ